jgi:hypothetical protein
MTQRTLNTVVSRAFRAAVGIHFACLFLLFFVLPYTLFGLWHFVVGVLLTALMLAILALFITDMVTKQDKQLRFSKLTDGVIGAVWIAVVLPLLMNSIRAGGFGSWR